MERRFKRRFRFLKIAIVVDMWLTGFDVPSLSTMYRVQADEGPQPHAGHRPRQPRVRARRAVWSWITSALQARSSGR
ncbi:MAG: UvrB domain 3-containing protein [Bifidobacterium pseudocatenulatum]